MNKTSLYLCALMTVAVAAYLLYLAATWNEYQTDRARRDAKINELLDRIPPPAKQPTVIVEP